MLNNDTCQKPLRLMTIAVEDWEVLRRQVEELSAENDVLKRGGLIDARTIGKLRAELTAKNARITVLEEALLQACERGRLMNPPKEDTGHGA